uniref:Wzt carbohydrate-binding domain-containing protein n=1 Tax=Yersinia alsatica TaxID=2890317 RepID=UPI001643D0C6
VIYGTNTYHLDKEIKSLTSGQIISFNFSFPMNLGEGSYSIAVALHEQDTHLHKNYEWRDLALIFDIINIDKRSFVGVSWLEPEVNYIYER